MPLTRLLAPALAVLLLLSACGGTTKVSGPDLAGAQQEVAAGNAALAAGEVATANAHYKAALVKDPANAQANLGAGLTELYLLESDPEVLAILSAFGSPAPPARLTGTSRVSSVLRRVGLGTRRAYDPVSNGRWVFGALLSMTHNPPLVSEVQAVLKSEVLPRLQYAEDRLDTIEGQPGFVWVIPDSVTGFYGPVEVDLGDVRILDAVVSHLQGTVGLLVAYDFDVPSYERVNAESLLTTGTAFGRLHADGAQQLAAARSNLLGATAEIEAAVTFILAETDDQSDDAIPAEALGTSSDVAALRAQLAEVRSALNGPTVFFFTDRLGNPDQITAFVGGFFTTPLQDLKSYLPAHAFDAVTHDPYILDPITFPDPTFNGIFPGMTNARWQSLIGPVAVALR